VEEQQEDSSSTCDKGLNFSGGDFRLHLCSTFQTRQGFEDGAICQGKTHRKTCEAPKKSFWALDLAIISLKNKTGPGTA
jgi:hypothetical protein